MLVLLAPWVLLLLTVISVTLLLYKKWKWSAIILIITLVLDTYVECFPLRLWSLPANQKDNTLKIMTFNINGINENIAERSYEIDHFIKSTDPDVVFVAEFPGGHYELIDSFLRKSYPYTTFEKDLMYFHYFYSKYPLLGSRRVMNKDESRIEIYYVGMLKGQDTVGFYGCHLASNNFTSDRKYITPDSVKNWSGLWSYVADVNAAYNQRADEISAVINEVRKSYHPVLIMGDMNDVGGSACIRKIEKAGFKDAWWEGGVGYGATIHRPLPYRIDHILYSEHFKLKEIEVVSSEGLSDHDALYTVFEY